jgi:hypothetical protein
MLNPALWYVGHLAYQLVGWNAVDDGDDRPELAANGLGIGLLSFLFWALVGVMLLIFF